MSEFMRIIIAPTTAITDKDYAERIAKEITDEFEHLGCLTIYDLKTKIGCHDVSYEDTIVGFQGYSTTIEIIPRPLSGLFWNVPEYVFSIGKGEVEK